MRGRFNKNESKDNSNEKILDVDASMQGTLSFKDPVNLRINGDFEGRLETKGFLTISKGAKVIAEIIGETVTIAGKVKGNIIATKELILCNPANIEGNIEAPLFQVEKGSRVNGHIKMNSNKETISKNILDIDEVAKYLEIDQSLVLEWANNGRLPGKKEGNNWKFNREVVDSWVSNEKIN
jgi:excisionase family DNA binding protein